jgi:uncharacterized membrane protein YphA (DoxX/SURF4 family)
MNISCLEKHSNCVPTVIRLVLGVLFVVAGIQKLMMTDAVTGMFSNMLGLPGGSATVYLVALVELVGGLMFLSGWNVRYAAMPLAVAMLVAGIAMWNMGLGNPDMNGWQAFMGSWSGFLAAMGSVSLMFSGPGAAAVGK